MTSAFLETLSSLKVADLPKGRADIIAIDSTASFESAFNRLVEGGVLSAPVRDVKTNKYVGFLDMRDLVSLVISVADDLGGGDDEAAAAADKKAPETLDELLSHVAKLHKYSADGPTVTYMARRNPFVSVSVGASVLEAARLLATPRTQRVHRVGVVDADGAVVNIVSQTTLVNFLAAHLGEISGLSEQTVDALTLGTRPAITVPDTTSALETFRLMDSKQRSGVGIVDATGRLVGNISGRDLKQFISTPRVEQLRVPIRKFLQQIHEDDVDIKAPTIAVTGDKTFGHVTQKLAATRVHRVYIVSGEKHYKPTGVISLTDVVKTMMKDDEVVAKAVAAQASRTSGSGATATAAAAATTTTSS